MSLPLPWVEKIFKKLTLTFGRDFVAKWEGSDPEEIKADWAFELRGFQQNPSALAYGLEHCLGGKPPTVHEFKALCSRRPDQTLRLPAAAANPERVAAEIAKLSNLRAGYAVDHKDWARKIVNRHASGERVNVYPLRIAREALGLEA